MQWSQLSQGHNSQGRGRRAQGHNGCNGRNCRKVTIRREEGAGLKVTMAAMVAIVARSQFAGKRAQGLRRRAQGNNQWSQFDLNISKLRKKLFAQNLYDNS